jgi:hypothetical protein
MTWDDMDVASAGRCVIISHPYCHLLMLRADHRPRSLRAASPPYSPSSRGASRSRHHRCDHERARLSSPVTWHCRYRAWRAHRCARAAPRALTVGQRGTLRYACIGWMPRRDRRRAPLAPVLGTNSLLSSQLPIPCLPHTSLRYSWRPSRAAPSVRRSLRGKWRPLRPRPAYTRAPRRELRSQMSVAGAARSSQRSGEVEPAETLDAGATSMMPVRFVMGRGTDARAGKQAAVPEQSPAPCATDVDVVRTRILPLPPCHGAHARRRGVHIHIHWRTAPRLSTLPTHSTSARSPLSPCPHRALLRPAPADPSGRQT